MVSWRLRREKVTRVLGKVVPFRNDPAMVVSPVFFPVFREGVSRLPIPWQMTD